MFDVTRVQAFIGHRERERLILISRGHVSLRLPAGVAARPSHNSLAGFEEMSDAGKEPHGAHQCERANVCVGESVVESDRRGQNGPASGDDVIYQKKVVWHLVRVHYG